VHDLGNGHLETAGNAVQSWSSASVRNTDGHADRPDLHQDAADRRSFGRRGDVPRVSLCGTRTIGNPEQFSLVRTRRNWFARDREV